MKDTINISSGKIFKLNGRKVILDKDVTTSKISDKGFFVLDMWNQCSIAQLDIFPVEYVTVNSNEEQYELFKYNIVMGCTKDICIE